jgi:hypothetical protein
LKDEIEKKIIKKKTQVNSSNLRHKSWDLDNLIEKKIKIKL